MKTVQTDNYFKFNDNVIQSIRSKYDLDGPGRMEEALDILQKWIQSQPHFRKKDFPLIYLESNLIGRKGSIERTKILLDKLCTMRTMMPQYFGKTNVVTDCVRVYDFVRSACLPKPTKDNYRVWMVKLIAENFSPTDYFNFFRLSTVGAEYVKTRDYQDGIVMVLDISEVNVLEFASKLDLVATRQGASILLEGYAFRLISVHLLTESKLVNSVVNIFKIVLGPNLGNRIYINKNVSELYDYIDRDVLPKEYGGDSPPLEELHNEWNEALSSKEHLNHLQDMMSATTDESCRQLDKFIDAYAGMPGTFRALKVD